MPERFIFLFSYSAVHIGQLVWCPIVYNLFGRPVLFRFEYCAGWEQVSGGFHRFAYWLSAIMLAFFALILKYEDESGMESFAFTTKYGRTKAVYAKTIAGLCTIVFLYTAASVIYAAVSVLLAGMSMYTYGRYRAE